MKKINLILLFFLIFNLVDGNLNGQEIQELNKGSFEIEGYSSNTSMFNIGDNYYFVIATGSSWGVDGGYLLKSDMDFNEISRSNSLLGFARLLYVDPAGEYCLLSENIMHGDPSGPLEDLTYTYNIVNLNLRTLEFERTDSLVDLIWNLEKLVWQPKSIGDSLVVGMGTLTINSSYTTYDAFYIEISTAGKIQDFGPFGLYDYNDGIFNSVGVYNFVYIEKLDAFFTMGWWTENYYLIDREYNIQQKIKEGVSFPGIYNGIPITNIDAAIFPAYMKVYGDSIHVIGTIMKDSSFLTHVRIPIYEDSIGRIDSLSMVRFLFDYEIKTQFERSVADEDNAGNVYVLLDNQISFNPRKVDTTTLYMMKTSYEKYRFRNYEWLIQLRDGTEFAYTDITVDKSGDIVIYGRNKTPETATKESWKNFYIKLKPDGTITSIKGIAPDIVQSIVYPNPTDGPLTVQSGEGEYTGYRVYNMHGRLLKEERLNGSFDISELYAGTYFIHFLNREGKAIGSSKVVKY